MTSEMSDSVPLSPEVAVNGPSRKRYPRTLFCGRNVPLVIVAVFAFLATSSRFGTLVAADQGGYYNDYGGYDYGGNNNNYEQESFEWPNDLGFDEVSVLPVSCIN